MSHTKIGPSWEEEKPKAASECASKFKSLVSYPCYFHHVLKIKQKILYINSYGQNFSRGIYNAMIDTITQSLAIRSSRILLRLVIAPSLEPKG